METNFARCLKGTVSYSKHVSTNRCNIDIIITHAGFGSDAILLQTQDDVSFDTVDMNLITALLFFLSGNISFVTAIL